MSFDKQTKRNEFFVQIEKEVLQLIDPATGEPYDRLVERVTCPVCDANGEFFLKKWGFTYEKCRQCGLIYVNPRLREELALKLYKEGSEANVMWATSVHQTEVQQKVNNEYFEQQVRFLRAYKDSGSLLDVGCGEGSFLDHAAKWFKCEGLELEENAVRISEGKGHRVRKSVLADIAQDGKSYDVISMFGVLEHLYNPLRDIQHVSRLLAKSGVIVGITPNAYSLVGMLLHNNARFYTPRNHPVIFSERSLRYLVEENGFKLLSLDTVLSGYESIVSSLEYKDPFGDFLIGGLPTKILTILKDREAFEGLLHKYDLGLRLRFVATRRS